MKRSSRIRISTIRAAADAVLFSAVFAAAAYRVLDGAAHEYFGTAVFGFALVHILFNRRWFGACLRGRYGFLRSLSTLVNVALCAFTLGVFASGMCLSREVFAFAGLGEFFDGMALRQFHTFCAYWLFVLSAVHLGLHWRGIAARICGGSASGRRALSAALWAWAAFGVWAWFERDMFGKLSGASSFDFIDGKLAAPLLFAEIFAIVCLIIAASDWASWRLISSKTNINKRN